MVMGTYTEGYYNRVPLIQARSEITNLKIVKLKKVQCKYDEKSVLFKRRLKLNRELAFLHIVTGDYCNILKIGLKSF